MAEDSLHFSAVAARLTCSFFIYLFSAWRYVGRNQHWGSWCEYNSI